MNKYDGIIKLIGAGTWMANENGDGGRKLSVLEIGDNQLNDIYLVDYLYNYLHQGKETTLLVYRSMMRHAIVAIKADGKKYKLSMDKIILEFFLKIILFSTIIITAGYAIPFMTESYHFCKPLGILLSALYAASKIKAFIDYLRF